MQLKSEKYDLRLLKMSAKRSTMASGWVGWVVKSQNFLFVKFISIVIKGIFWFKKKSRDSNIEGNV